MSSSRSTRRPPRISGPCTGLTSMVTIGCAS
uniref:Uncharacterized protein n=1 Tax=Siphoviridae sp. ctRGj11 TaxID=2827868 RepID=A0A8S5SJN5_9CAUD|nr:MAG TPA: hypothetical protein [Siphoviridae sp. ctRGj11]